MSEENASPGIAERLEAAFGRADDASHGWLGVLRRTVDKFARARGPQAAAALSYYGLFSLFPLAVLLIIFLFGGEVIRGFAFALMMGVAVGTYSSLFNAAPVAYGLLMRKNKGKGKH